MRLPKTISLQVSRKLADKTKDEIMTEVLRAFARHDVKAVQVAYEVVRVTFASPEHFREEKSFSENGIFSFYGALSWGAAPLLRACTFSIFLSRRTTRSLEVAFEACGAVKSIKKQTFLSNQIIFDGTRLVDVALSGVQGHRSANYPNKEKCKSPLKESEKIRAHLPKGVILLQALLSVFVLPIAKGSTVLLPILLN